MSIVKEAIDKGLKVDLISGNDVPNDINQEPSVDAIPDLDLLMKNINLINDYLDLPETKKMLKSNPGAVNRYLNEKYLNVPYGILTLLLERDNKEVMYENGLLLLEMIETLRKAKEGVLSINDASKNFTNKIKSKYKATEQDIERELSLNSSIGKMSVRD